jgi:putative flippase GtrA
MKDLEFRSIQDVLRHKETQRFLRFLLVGLSGTILDFAILTILKTFFGVPTIIANTISYSVGVINNFILNRAWTFSEARDKHWLMQFGQFLVINIIGIGINNLIVVGLEHPLGQLLHIPSAGFLPAKLVATGVVVIWNFIANRLWTFREVSNSKS